MDIFEWLQNWYTCNCDGEWEHWERIKISTIDNPGWSVFIGIYETPLENKPFSEIRIDNGDDDWIFCSVEEYKFHGVGDSTKLMDILKIFKEWVES